jgi:hypothetical protein
MMTTLLVLSGSSAGTESVPGDDLAWPPLTREMRPWTRWWWLGSAVDNKNISALLKTYHDAGLGGVEVTPIYGVQGQENRKLTYLSPEWVSALKHTIGAAAALDMGVDMPTGTGWPFGGPHVTDADADDKLVIDARKVASGEAYTLPRDGPRPEALVAVPDHGESISLLDKMGTAGDNRWIAPAGHDWTIYRVGIKWSGRGVKRAAPGGTGKCINPFAKRSLDRYLARFDEPLSQLGPGALRCQFHDSFEYAADWSPDLIHEFKKRRGYNLLDHLPAFVNAADPEHARVRTDYRETIGELLLEDFTRNWTEWAHKKGTKTRNQAHGSPGNLLDLYGAVDIPETEVFRSIGDPRITKFASSAAHVLGKRLTSSESCTWQSEHFTETLGTSKRILDRLMVGGVNHIFYHGTAYSPADAAWPGWLFYASTHFEPSNPTWQDFPTLNHYVTRCQSLMQSGVPDHDVLLYWPLHDLWQNHPRTFGLTIEGTWLASEPVGATARQLWDRGYAYDYISDSMLRAATAKDGQIQMPGGSYRVVLVPPCKYMPAETLGSLIALASQGATVLFEQSLPSDVPGLGDFQNRRAEIAQLVGSLHLEGVGDHGIKRARVGNGEILIGPAASDLLGAANVRREKVCDHSGMMFERRRDKDGSIYLLVNQGNTPVDGYVSLSTTARSAVLMDAMTGQTGVAKIRRAGSGMQSSSIEVYLQLAPGGSILVRTLADRQVRGARWVYRAENGTPVALTGSWTVRYLKGGPVLPQPVSTPVLGSWTACADPELHRFAGTARYSLKFDAPPGSSEWLLDLGDVHESATVRLNGKELGTLLLAPWQIALTGLKRRDNLLEVDVTSVAANRIRDMDRRKVTWRIFKEINFVNIDYKPFDASQWPVRDCGLLGPVRLIPTRHHTP